MSNSTIYTHDCAHLNSSCSLLCLKLFHQLSRGPPCRAATWVVVTDQSVGRRSAAWQRRHPSGLSATPTERLRAPAKIASSTTAAPLPPPRRRRRWARVARPRARTRTSRGASRHVSRGERRVTSRGEIPDLSQLLVQVAPLHAGKNNELVPRAPICR